MSKQLKGLLYFFITDIRNSLLIFWSILLSVIVISVIVAYYLLSVEDGNLSMGFPFAIYIYCAILGFITVKEVIPFSLKMGATRKKLFVAIGLFFLGIALAKSALASTLQAIISQFTNKAEIHTFEFLHLASLFQDTWLNRVIIDTTIMFFLLAIMFIIGLLFYKYGLIGGGSVVGIIAILLLTGTAKGWIVDIFAWIFADTTMTFFYQLLVLGIVIYCLSFLFLQRITTVKVK